MLGCTFFSGTSSFRKVLETGTEVCILISGPKPTTDRWTHQVVCETVKSRPTLLVDEFCGKRFVKNNERHYAQMLSFSPMPVWRWNYRNFTKHIKHLTYNSVPRLFWEYKKPLSRRKLAPKCSRIKTDFQPQSKRKVKREQVTSSKRKVSLLRTFRISFFLFFAYWLMF